MKATDRSRCFFVKPSTRMRTCSAPDVHGDVYKFFILKGFFGLDLCNPMLLDVFGVFPASHSNRISTV